MARVEKDIFQTPSGNVGGVITAHAVVGKREKRIAHAYLLTDAAPTITLSVTGKVTSEQVDDIIGGLIQFAEELRRAGVDQ